MGAQKLPLPGVSARTLGVWNHCQPDRPMLGRALPILRCASAVGFEFYDFVPKWVGCRPVDPRDVRAAYPRGSGGDLGRWGSLLRIDPVGLRSGVEVEPLPVGCGGGGSERSYLPLPCGSGCFSRAEQRRKPPSNASKKLRSDSRDSNRSG